MCGKNRGQDQVQKKPQPVEDEAENVADGAEHSVGLITMAALEVIAAEMTGAFHMADHRLNG